MTAPLKYMRIRNAEDDCEFRDSTVTSRLNSKSSPVGGAFGNVRSFGHKGHQGWDLYAAESTPVLAVADGVVEFSVTNSGGDYGQQLCIRLQSKDKTKYPTGVYAFYAHLSQIIVTKGERVSEGQIIAFSGKSGNAGNTPPHLHFEMRTLPRPGKGLKHRIDPGEFLSYSYYSCSGPLSPELLAR